MLEPLIDYATANPEQTATVAAGLSTAAEHYRRTGKLPIGRLPWRSLRQITRDLRDQYFSKARPKGVPALVVDATPDAIADTLRQQYFEYPPASYDYDGEALNLRRPAGTAPDPATGEPVATELHTRGFLTADERTLLISHVEASRYEAQARHLDGTLTSFGDGRDGMQRVLGATDLRATAIPSEREAGIEAV